MVPAAGGITAPLTSQANRACPALWIFIAPTKSAFSFKPQDIHLKRACVLRFSFEMRLQAGQVRLVFWGGTLTSQPPAHASLYSSCLRNSPHPCSRMALFSLDLARTFLPGASFVP